MINTLVIILMYVFALKIYIISFYLRASTYKSIFKIPTTKDILVAKNNPEFREKVPIKMWHVIFFTIVFLIPLINCIFAIVVFAYGSKNEDQFYIFNESNPITKMFKTITNFLNKNLNQ